MKKKTANPAALDKLCDILGRMDAVSVMLDVIGEQCADDGRVHDAVFGVECLVNAITESLDAFRADFEKEAAV